MGGRARTVEYRNDDENQIALAAASWGKVVVSETRQRPYAETMATAAFAVFSVSTSSLSSIAGEAMGVTEDDNSKYEEEQY